MYHRVVASRVRNAFVKISAGDYESMIDGMARRSSYRFYGEHALSGERHTPDALRQWWQRSFRLLGPPVFEVEDVVVSGWPWNTTVATRVTVRARVAGDVPYNNVFMQFMTIRWGKIADVKTLEDTVVLQRALDAAAAAGMTEAHAAPIVDTLASA